MEMGKITKFFVAAFSDGALQADCTPEVMQESLLARDGAQEIRTFLENAEQPGFVYLSAAETITGKFREGRPTDQHMRGYLRRKFLDESFDQRVATVIAEAKLWDFIEQQSAYKAAGDALCQAS
jgi:hypothetical protein